MVDDLSDENRGLFTRLAFLVEESENNPLSKFRGNFNTITWSIFVTNRRNTLSFVIEFLFFFLKNDIKLEKKLAELWFEERIENTDLGDGV